MPVDSPQGTLEAPTNIRPPVQPLLKWAGGKRWLTKELLALFPARARRYYEPFLGGAAAFFAFQPKDSTLSDANAELINCYEQVRDHPEAVLRILGRFGNSEKSYYKVRGMQPASPVERAARLLFLTTLSFNGIFRQNLEGVFNVPYGHKVHLDPADPGKILSASKALQSSTLLCADFEHATRTAKRGDLIYFDPPYTVAHGNNGFVKYNAKIFSWEDQIRLASVAERLRARGCFVFVSNADHDSIRELYAGFDVRTISRHSKIAASRAYRKPITECLFFNGEELRA